MEQTKKSFLLYFDMYPHLKNLSASQRGELLTALFEYAQREAENPGSGNSVADRFPNMDPETRMAFFFIAATILRDTVKWHEKHLRYQKAALERHGKEQTASTEAWQYV